MERKNGITGKKTKLDQWFESEEFAEALGEFKECSMCKLFDKLENSRCDLVFDTATKHWQIRDHTGSGMKLLSSRSTIKEALQIAFMELLTYVNIDTSNRPVFKSSRGNYYGDVENLFPYEESGREVRKKVDESTLVYFGKYFGCEPMGTPARDIKIDWT